VTLRSLVEWPERAVRWRSRFASVDAEILHDAAPHHLGKLLGVGGARHLAPQRLFLQPLGLPLVEGSAQLLEALVQERSALLDVDEALLALELLELAIGVLDPLPRLLDLPAQPLPRLGRGLGAQVEALPDVELGEGVGGGGGEFGPHGGDADLDEAAVADGTDGDAAQEGVDRRLHRRVPSRGLGEDGLDLLPLPRPLVLGVVQGVEPLDEELGRGLADGPGQERAQGGDGDDRGEDGDDHPAVAQRTWR
jgi:hypothetical protein